MQFLMYSPLAAFFCFLLRLTQYHIAIRHFRYMEGFWIRWIGFYFSFKLFTHLFAFSSHEAEANPPPLCIFSPLPRHLPKFCQSGAWGPEKEKQDGATWWLTCWATNGKHGFCKKAAWSFSSVTYYFIHNLAVIKRKYFIFNKKAEVCV